MKITIWKRDDFLRLIGTARIDMDAEAVVLPTEGVPLTMDFDYQKPPIGKVENVRVEDGEVVGDVTWFEHSEITDEIWEDWYEDLYRFAGYYSGVQPYELDYENGDRITSARLRVVSIVSKVNVPGSE